MAFGVGRLVENREHFAVGREGRFVLDVLADLFGEHRIGRFGHALLDLLARRLGRVHIAGVIKVGRLVQFADELEKDLTDRNRRNRENDAEQTEKLEIAPVLGGRAFLDNQTRRRFPAAHFIESFAELAEFARDLKR